MRNDLFTQVLDFSYVQIIKVPGEGFKQDLTRLTSKEHLQMAVNKEAIYLSRVYSLCVSHALAIIIKIV